MKLLSIICFCNSLIASSPYTFPIVFEKSNGQVNSPVLYTAHGRGYNVEFQHASWKLSTLLPTRASSLTIRLLGARSGTAVDAVDLLAAKTNYLLGNDPSAWRTGGTNYSRIR